MSSSRLQRSERMPGRASNASHDDEPGRSIFDSPAGDYCVDIFERDDGTFGLEEYRRDAEDLKGWFPLYRHSRQVFATDEDALAYARKTVVWMTADPK